MLLHEYLDGIQSIIEGYSRASLILASDVSSDFRTEKIGIIRGTIDFIDESSLHFTEYLDLRYGIEKLTYSFHYQDRYGNLIFRYDNARHKPALDSEDHKHLPDGHTISSHEPEVKNVFTEIMDLLLQ
jgi:hypothetical protein